MYTYSYLIANLGLLALWLLLFLFRKDVRREMLVVSIVFGFAGILSEYIYTSDWWQPPTITGSRIGLEDFMFGFWVGGVSAVIYEEVFKKKLRARKPNSKKLFLQGMSSLLLLLTLFLTSFYAFKLSSFYSSVVAFVPLIAWIWIKRKDLIINSLFSGLLLPLVGLLWFWIPELITPGWVEKYWLFENLSGIIILKAPLEDLIWGFLAGAYIGPLYEFWQGSKLVSTNSKRN